MKYVLIFVCDVCCTSENSLPVGEGVWSMCNSMKTGRHGGMAFNSGRTDVGHHACPLQMMRGVQTCSAGDTRELDICWVVHRIVWDQPDYRDKAAIFSKRSRLLHQSIVLSQENARRHTPSWTAVYGRTSDRLWISPTLVLSVSSLTESLISTWLASDCNKY